MKLLIDCDAVFDRLTRGPFPSGASDDTAVEAHLAVCHECRELAEALRPAVKLMHEAYAEAASDDQPLPVYRGAVDRAVERRTSAGSHLGRKDGSARWALVAAALIGVLLGSAATGGWFSHGKYSQLGTALSGEQRPAAAGAHGLATLAGLHLSEACLPSGMQLASGASLRCCTDCHTAEQKKEVDVARVQLACVACHEPRP